MTPRGAQLARDAIVVVEAADADFFAAAQDTRALIETLHRLAD